jgi:hypothetical protein
MVIAAASLTRTLVRLAPQADTPWSTWTCACTNAAVLDIADARAHLIPSRA